MWTRDCKLFSTCLYRMWFSLPVATILSVFFMVSSSELIIFFMVFSSEQVFLIQSPVGADASGCDVLSHAPELVAVTRCLAHGVPECFLVGGPLRSLGWAFPLPPRPARALRSPSVPSRPVPSRPITSRPIPPLPSPPLPSPPLLSAQTSARSHISSGASVPPSAGSCPGVAPAVGPSLCPSAWPPLGRLLDEADSFQPLQRRSQSPDPRSWGSQGRSDHLCAHLLSLLSVPLRISSPESDPESQDRTDSLSDAHLVLWQVQPRPSGHSQALACSVLCDPPGRPVRSPRQTSCLRSSGLVHVQSGSLLSPAAGSA